MRQEPVRSSEEVWRKPANFDGEFVGAFTSKIIRIFARDQQLCDMFSKNYPHAFPLLLQSLVENQRDAAVISNTVSSMRYMVKHEPILSKITTTQVEDLVSVLRRLLQSTSLTIEQSKIISLKTRLEVDTNEHPVVPSIQSLAYMVNVFSKVPVLRDKLL